MPAPTPDADNPTPALDAPIFVDAVLPDAGSPDSLLDRDVAGERTGDARADGGKAADGGREAGVETREEARGESEDASQPDAPPEVDAEATTDSAPDISDTNSSSLPDAQIPPDAAIVSVVKLTGAAFGTGPAFSAHPTATYDKAFDNDPTTYFDDSNGSGGYAGIDVGSTAVARFIRYYPREDFNDRMVGGIFQCSPSSQTDGYVDLFTITAVPPLAWTTVSMTTAQPCRFFRYLGPTDGFTNLGEIELWAAGEGSGGTTSASFGAPLYNVALGRPASASSEQTSAGKVAANGNDGVVSTMFCPANGSFPDWYQVDLGDTYPVQQTGIVFESSSTAYQYQIDVSLDGSQWSTTAARLSGVTGGHSTITDNFQAQARYLRVTFTGSSTGRWGCVKELMVWSTTAPSPDGGI